MDKSDEILRLLRENNKMLKEICAFLCRQQHDVTKEDFVGNVIANIIGNHILPVK